MATETVNFAFPVIRIETTADYAAVADRLDFARDLRQTAGDSAAEGLEIRIDISIDATLSHVFAMFDGNMKYDPKSPKRLRFEFEPKLVDYKIERSGKLERLNRSCEQIKYILYDGIDPTTLKDRLAELIQQAYKAYTDKPKGTIPRVLKSKVSVTTSSQSPKKLEKKSKKKTFELLSRLQSLGDEGTRTAFVNDVVAGIAMNGGSLLVSAGDCIGDAAVVDPGKRAQVDVTIQDGTNKNGPGNAFNPVYLLHLIAKKRSEITFVWSVGIEDLLSPTALPEDDLKKKVHPLLKQLAAKSWGPFMQTVGIYSLTTDTPSLFVPSTTAAPVTAPKKVARNATVKAFHGYPHVNPASKYEWRLADDLYFKYKSRTGLDSPNDADEAYFTFDHSVWKLVMNAWKAYGPVVNGVATVFTAPCEVLLAFLAHESGGQARNCGIEYLLDNPTDLSGPNDPLWKYFKLTAVADIGTADAPKTLFDWDSSSKVDKLIPFLRNGLNLNWVESGKVNVTASTDNNKVTVSSLDATNSLAVSRTAGSTVITISYSVGGTAHTYELPMVGGKVYNWKKKRTQGVVPADEEDYTELIDPSRSSDYTWQTLINDLNGQSKLWKRVSPGLAQTLISTTVSVLQSLDQQEKDDLGITLPDLIKGGEVFKWLLEPKHSLAVGAAFKVSLNNGSSLGFDLPELASAYNSGSVKSLGGSCKEGPNPFNLCFTANYLLGTSGSLAPCYNAAIRLFDRYDLFDQGELNAPTVRFE